MRLIPFLIAGTALGTMPAFAQETPAQSVTADAATPADIPAATTPAEDEGGAGEIVVTATRRAQNIQEVPLAVTAIGGEQLQRNVVLTANDISRLVPNFTGANGGGRVARPRYFLRGVGVNDPSGNVTSPIGIYVDDVYFNDTAYHAFPLFDLERVEVLRGPQGTLWGKNTIGGAVNYLSRRPSFEADGYLRAEAGSFDSWAVQGAAGGTIIPGLLAARIAFNYEDRGGYYQNLYNGETDGGVRDQAVRAQLLFTPASNLSILFNFHARDLRDGGAPGYKIGTGVGGADSFGYVQTYGTTPRVGDPVSLDAPTPPATLSSRGGLTNIQYDAGWLTLTSITSYDEIEREGLTDGDGTPLPAQVAHSFVNSNQFAQELRVASDSRRPFSFTLGSHYFRENFHQDAATGTLAAVAARPGFSAIRTAYQNTVIDQDTESFAIFGEATYRFTPRFRVALGGRWTTETRAIALNGVQGVTGSTVFNNTGQWWLRPSVTSVLNTNAVQNEERTWQRFTYSVTPQYDITDNVRVYARVATGFRSGGFNGNVTSQVAVNVVEPEELTDYEVGLKSEWFDNRLIVNLSGFYYDYQNIQVNVQGALNGQSATTLRNAANGRISGAELEITARPTDRLTLRFNGGWLFQAEYSDFLTTVLVNNVATTVDASGNQIARAPLRTATLDFEYRIPLGGDHELSIGADANYRSHIFFNAVDQTDPLQEQDEYVLVNARLGYAFGRDRRFNVSAYVLNLTDTEYVHNNNVPRNGAYSLTLGPPRTWGVALTTRF